MNNGYKKPDLKSLYYDNEMEAFGIIGFVFGLGALGKIIMLEEKLKELGVLKEKAESGKN